MRPAFAVPCLALALCLPLCAQKTRHPEAKTARDAKVAWDGEWTLVADESDQVATLIDEHLKEQNFAMKAWWKRKLTASCKAHPTLDILVGDSVSITLGRETPIDTPADGKTAEWKRSDGDKFQVSLRQEDRRMTQTFRGDGYTLTHVYSMRKDGKTLALQATYSHPKLDSPFSYKLVFSRKD